MKGECLPTRQAVPLSPSWLQEPVRKPPQPPPHQRPSKRPQPFIVCNTLCFESISTHDCPTQINQHRHYLASRPQEDFCLK